MLLRRNVASNVNYFLVFFHQNPRKSMYVVIVVKVIVHIMRHTYVSDFEYQSLEIRELK